MTSARLTSPLTQSSLSSGARVSSPYRNAAGPLPARRRAAACILAGLAYALGYAWAAITSLRGRDWIEGFRSALITFLGKEPPVDMWAINVYPLVWDENLLPTVDT